MRYKSQETIDSLMEAIDSLNKVRGRIPTVSDLQEATGLARGTVAKYLKYMKEQNLIEYEPRHRVCRKDAVNDEFCEIVMIPLLGSIICGSPDEQAQNIEEYIPMPASLLGGGDFFLLHTYGESMIDAGIDDGDIVLVRSQQTADPGDIVAAITEDGGTTLKRLERSDQNGRFCLRAENSSDAEFRKFCMTKFSVQGVVMKIIKDPK